MTTRYRFTRRGFVKLASLAPAVLWVKPALAQPPTEIIWIAPLIELTPNHWYPAIETIRRGATGSFPCVWKPSRFPQHWAVGTASVDAAQLTAVNASPTVLVATRALAANPLSGATATVRIRLNAFATEAGEPLTQDTETLLDFVNRMAIRARGFGLGNLDRHLALEVAAYRKMAD